MSLESTPATSHRRWGVRGTVAAIGVAAAIAAGGGAAVYAATGHSGNPGFGHGMPPGPPPSAFGPDVPQALHGEFVVADGTGGYTTMLTQNGTVTAVSGNAITVRSADDYTQTYVLPPGAQAGHPVATDDEVEVRAKRTGTTATATTLTERR
jgi:hypothetical protein